MTYKNSFLKDFMSPLKVVQRPYLRKFGVILGTSILIFIVPVVGIIISFIELYKGFIKPAWLGPEYCKYCKGKCKREGVFIYEDEEDEI